MLRFGYKIHFLSLTNSHTHSTVPCMSVVNYLSLHNHRHHHSIHSAHLCLSNGTCYSTCFFALLVFLAKLLSAHCRFWKSTAKIKRYSSIYSLQSVAGRANARVSLTTHARTHNAFREFCLFALVIFHFSTQVHLKVPRARIYCAKHIRTGNTSVLHTTIGTMYRNFPR